MGKSSRSPPAVVRTTYVPPRLDIRTGLLAPDCVIVLDEPGRIEQFGPEAEHLFGYRDQQVLDQNLRVLLSYGGHGWQWRTVWRCLAMDARCDAGARVIVIGKRRDGRTFPMELTVHEERLPGERLFTAAVRDLTLTVERDRRGRELRDELIRTAHICELDRLASTLIGGVIRPLAALHDDLAAGQTPFRSRDADAARLLMALLLEAAERSSGIILELRALMRTDATEKQVEDLRDAIEVAAGLALQKVRRQLRLTIDVADDAAEAVIDKHQIQQVLRNLIAGALRVMEASARREVTIFTRHREDMVEIRVACAGTSPAAENLFELVPATGSGVDLMVCRAIVEDHGGELHALDGEDGGALFRLTLPHPRRRSDGAST